jgi:hypothetical protein
MILCTILTCTPRAPFEGIPLMGLYTPLVLAAVAGFGAAAAVAGRGIPLLIAATVSFVPTGYYLTLTGGAFQWVGWLNILTAFAAVGMDLARAVLSTAEGHKW